MEEVSLTPQITISKDTKHIDSTKIIYDDKYCWIFTYIYNISVNKS